MSPLVLLSSLSVLWWRGFVTKLIYSVHVTGQKKKYLVQENRFSLSSRYEL